MNPSAAPRTSNYEQDTVEAGEGMQCATPSMYIPLCWTHGAAQMESGRSSPGTAVPQLLPLLAPPALARHIITPDNRAAALLKPRD